MRPEECNCGEVVPVEESQELVGEEAVSQQEDGEEDVVEGGEEAGRRWSRGRMTSGAVWTLR